MKITISTTYYTPHISGLTNSIKNLAELLTQNGYKITVLTTQHKKQLQQKETAQNILIERVPYLLRLSKGFLMPTYFFRAYDTVKKSDCVLLNLPQFEGVVVAVLAKMLGKKVHSIYVCDITLQESLFSKIILWILSLSNNLCLYLSDTIITLTEDFAKSSPTLKRRKNIRCIPPVIVAPKIEVAKQNEMEKIFSLDNFLIGFLGRIASEKGIEYLLEAIPYIQKQFPEKFKIILAGPSEVVGEKEYKQRIKNLLNKYSDYVVQIDEVKDKDLGAFYAMLDVLVLPSINSTEVFGMVQVEAMLCGTPVVASDLPGVRTVVRQTGMGEIAKRKNTKDLANKIVSVLKYRKSYTKREKEVQEIFASQNVLEQYQKIFSS